jgi:hypothetical protein
MIPWSEARSRISCRWRIYDLFSATGPHNVSARSPQIVTAAASPAAEVRAAERLEKAENDAMERTVALTSPHHSYVCGLTELRVADPAPPDDKPDGADVKTLPLAAAKVR